MAKLSEIYNTGNLAVVASTGSYHDLEGTPDIAALAPIRWTTVPVKTANYIANNAENVPCNSSGGPFSVTLPAIGNRVRIFDAVGTPTVEGFETNPVTVLPNVGTTVMGADGMALDLNSGAFEFELVGSDWRVAGGIVPVQDLPHYSRDILDINRGNHVGTQLANTISDFDEAVNATVGISFIVFDGGNSATSGYPVTLEFGGSI